MLEKLENDINEAIVSLLKEKEKYINLFYEVISPQETEIKNRITVMNS